MSDYRVVALSPEVVEEVRRTHRAPDYGHPAWLEEKHPAGAPCRTCLRRFEADEPRLLFTYDAFRGRATPPLPGPIYVHAVECERYAPDEPLPPYFVDKPMTFQAYGDGRRLVSERQVDNNAAETIADMFARPEVSYVHARSADAGCYLFTVERPAREA
ncbi:DUF1203 domain-containing protein [Streptoalloteichus hindustanus]|uniref:DUF1203 domain-containing protein n=1 Tax=Streptoalloteichus hindustanus TaxID=2017 RepID=A0A1M5B2F8_STRHI|nr:DUF1203 domain-containing protein [Streptoalloteichus hindustanus]SHF36649.1 Protein of unknown function [Streptoalloteichus hindustanus]